MSSSSNAPCAACKCLRRKCTRECVFAPHFPPDNPEKFTNVHRIFGASNVSKLLSRLDPGEREDAAKSLAYEAEYRLKDPVYGCVAVVYILQQKLKNVLDNLAYAQSELATFNPPLNPHGPGPSHWPGTSLGPPPAHWPGPGPSQIIPYNGQPMIPQGAHLMSWEQQQQHVMAQGIPLMSPEQQQQPMIQCGPHRMSPEQPMIQCGPHRMSPEQQPMIPYGPSLMSPEQQHMIPHGPHLMSPEQQQQPMIPHLMSPEQQQQPMIPHGVHLMSLEQQQQSMIQQGAHLISPEQEIPKGGHLISPEQEIPQGGHLMSPEQQQQFLEEQEMLLQQQQHLQKAYPLINLNSEFDDENRPYYHAGESSTHLDLRTQQHQLLLQHQQQLHLQQQQLQSQQQQQLQPPHNFLGGRKY